MAKVAFTRCNATGKKVMASAAGGVKRVTLKLWGEGATVGSSQNQIQTEKVRVLLYDTRETGTSLSSAEPPNQSGHFIPSTIVRDLPGVTPPVREEQFDPVLPVLKYRDSGEVFGRAIDSGFGLGGEFGEAGLHADTHPYVVNAVELADA